MMINSEMKINCDMGESFGIWTLGCDDQIMPYLDMANIACGMHASDPKVMLDTVRLAKRYQVTIGAHPGYPDLQGFGRRTIPLSDDELLASFIYQIGALQAICRSESTQLSYVKPHGALYNTMMKDDHVFTILLRAMERCADSLPLVIMGVPNADKYVQMANDYGITLLFEAFVDRAYDDDGRLVPRHVTGSTYHDLDTIRRQAIELMRNQRVMTLSGNFLNIHAHTLCIHGDGPMALPTAQMLRQELEAGVLS